MSDPTVEGFFDNTRNTGNNGAPSATLKAVDDFVFGEVVDQFIVDAKKFGKDEVELDAKTGQPVKQLVVILQTDLRNWAGVSKIPVVDPKDKNSPQKDPSEDDGRRAVYVKPWTNIHAAVGAAVEAATGQKGPLVKGGKLGVKITELEDTGKGNPLKHHAAKYEAPSASADFFGDSNTQGGSGDAAASAPPAAAPASEPAAQPQASQDPWATSAPAAGGQKPPF